VKDCICSSELEVKGRPVISGALPGGFEEMARGYNWIIYTVFESEVARRIHEEHPAHMELQEEFLAIWAAMPPSPLWSSTCDCPRSSG
jgi:Stress responsive A/B Barrel Domain